MNMSQFQNASFRLFFCCIIILISSLTGCTTNEPPVLTIIHTNDTHSQFDARINNGDTLGGFIERAAIIEAMRETDPNLLYFDGGDMVQGSPYFNIFKGLVEMQGMNLLGLNAATLGNHEFDNGQAFLVEMIKKADFPFLSCNLNCDSTILAPYIKKHIIIQHNNMQIGVTGITTALGDLVSNNHLHGIQFIDPLEAANQQAAILREQGCDLIIVLSHVGYERNDTTGDRRIALLSENIDLIIGGHTHTNLEHGVTLTNAKGQPVTITQTGGRENAMGRIRIEMQPDTLGTPAKWMVKNITCDKLYPKDYNLTGKGKEAQTFLQPFTDSLQSQMDITIGHAPVTMQRFRPQSPLGNFTADALRYMSAKHLEQMADVAIMNIGGIRSDLDSGTVTIGDIYRSFPFENSLTLLQIKGDQLELLLQRLAGKKLEALSGVQITLQTINHKTIAKDIRVGGKKIDPNRYYWIATIDYLAEGNDGLRALANPNRRIDTGILLRNMMITYISELTQKGKPVAASIDNRVIELK